MIFFGDDKVVGVVVLWIGLFVEVVMVCFRRFFNYFFIDIWFVWYVFLYFFLFEDILFFDWVVLFFLKKEFFIIYKRKNCI